MYTVHSYKYKEYLLHNLRCTYMRNKASTYLRKQLVRTIITKEYVQVHINNDS